MHTSGFHCYKRASLQCSLGEAQTRLHVPATCSAVLAGFGGAALLLTILVKKVIFSVKFRCSSRDLIFVDLCMGAPQQCVRQQSFWAVIMQLRHPKTEIKTNKAFLQLPETCSIRESWEQLWE